MRAASQPSDPGDQDTASLQQLVPQADLVFAQPLEELDPSDTEQEKVLLRLLLNTAPACSPLLDCLCGEKTDKSIQNRPDSQ